MLPTVALIGRPNVGKSTLFNALLGERRSIVSDVSGTTRDSLLARIDPTDQFGDSEDMISYYLVDTAGLTNTKGETLEDEMRKQTEIALEKADLVILLLDGKAEITADDEDIIQTLRKGKKPVLLVVNKIDDGNSDKVWEMTRFGMGTPFPISAKNFFGVWELQDELQTEFRKLDFETTEPREETDSVKVALVGRPNVGKSSLFNQLIGAERAVVSDVSGTTRDTLDTEITDEEGNSFLFVDSAGLRRPGKIGRQNIEYWSVVRTQQAMERADICVLLIDALDGMTHQDMSIAGKIIDAGKGLIIAVNKFDLVREKTQADEDKETDDRELDEVKMWGEDLDEVRKRYLAYLRQKVEFIPWAPVLFFSAKTGKGVQEIFPALKAISEERERRIDTAELNRFATDCYFGHVTPSVGTKIGKMKYASQVDTHPPKFLFFVNNTQAFHWSYKRYLENKLREKYGFHGTPIKVEFRDSMDKFKGKKKEEN